MNIENLTIAEARQISAIFRESQMPVYPSPWKVGENYFIRTVTHHLTGRLVYVTDKELVLENAAWIADDGRLTEALQKSEFNEVEMFPVDQQVIVGRGSLIDAVRIKHIPVSQK
jgi:hypothetical protein